MNILGYDEIVDIGLVHHKSVFFFFFFFFFFGGGGGGVGVIHI